MRQSSRIVAISLVSRERLERLMGLPALDARHGQAKVARPFVNSSAIAAARRRRLGRERPYSRGRERKHAKDEFLLAAVAQNLRKLAKLIPLPAPVFAT
jgi:hypothetical protein